MNDEPIGARLDSTLRVAYPNCSMVINVTQAPYFAKGDGKTDDTNAIQSALSDMMGQHKLLYFPTGTYLISKTLQWSKKNSAGQDAWGMNFLVGESVHDTVIRLHDGVFTDVAAPQSMMWCGGFGSADWFHNYVENLTFHVGQNNPAATALQFYSNNSGAVRNCRFIAPTGSGWTGLDLGHRDMNGPLLVRNCEITGFQCGIHTSRSVNGQTFEHITLRQQSKIGMDNEGQVISVRGLKSENSVPAVKSYGTLCLIDSHLVGTQDSHRWPAMINYNGGRMMVRDVSTPGYLRSIGDIESPDWIAAMKLTGEDKPGSLGPAVSEYSSHPATMAFPSPDRSLRLPIREPPVAPSDDPTRWANVDAFGADPQGVKDSSDAIQRAIDSGAATVFFPGSYSLQSTVVVRGKVSRLVGIGGMIDYFKKTHPDFRIEDGESPVVSFEHFGSIHGGVEVNTNRTILFRSVSDCDLTFSDKSVGGELFFEDFVTHDLKLRGQKVWARQLNVVNEGTHILNDNSKLWILGYKTERGGTLIETCRGGQSEVLGGFSYTTTAGKLAPMYVTNNASVFTFFHEVCYNGDPFAIKILEIRDNVKKSLSKDEGHTAPYSGRIDPNR